MRKARFESFLKRILIRQLLFRYRHITPHGRAILLDWLGAKSFCKPGSVGLGHAQADTALCIQKTVHIAVHRGVGVGLAFHTVIKEALDQPLIGRKIFLSI